MKSTELPSCVQRVELDRPNNTAFVIGNSDRELLKVRYLNAKDKWLPSSTQTITEDVSRVVHQLISLLNESFPGGLLEKGALSNPNEIFIETNGSNVTISLGDRPIFQVKRDSTLGERAGVIKVLRHTPQDERFEDIFTRSVPRMDGLRVETIEAGVQFCVGKLESVLEI